MRWGAVGAGAGAVAAAAAAALLCALVVLTPGVQWDALAGRGGGAVRIHSVGYYENLAAADKWEAGPATGAALADDERVRRGRTQLLAQVRARRLGSRGHALVRLCAQGNDQACAQIAGNPRELRALQEAQQRAQQLRLRAPSDQQQEMMAGVKRAARAMANQEAMAYQDQADAGNIWDASHWQSGALGDVVSNQWLAACGQGNAAACNHIAKSNGALQALLTASSTPGPPIEAYMPSTAPPKAVYVSAKPKKSKPGMLSDVLSFLGLGDNFDKSGVHTAAIPKMVPDVGFHKGPKYTAVWNDGTIAPELSDNANAKKFYHDAGKMLKTIDFSDTVKAKPQALWKQ